MKMRATTIKEIKKHLILNLSNPFYLCILAQALTFHNVCRGLDPDTLASEALLIAQDNLLEMLLKGFTPSLEDANDPIILMEYLGDILDMMQDDSLNWFLTSSEVIKKLITNAKA